MTRHSSLTGMRLIRPLIRWGMPVLLGFGLLPPPGGAGPDAPATGALWPASAGTATTTAPALLASATAQVASRMAAAGQPYAGWVADGRTFVAFDTRGDGRAIELIGDLATADRVIVLVPGAGVRLADFDRGLGGVAHRAPARQARALLAEARAIQPGAHLAVVAWLGYDPPDGLGLDAARDDQAARGAPDLAAFVATVAAVRPDAGVTVVGHSYGAVVIGRAASRLRQVTDLVALGAPGMGVSRASDLHTPARVWAAQADQDWIQWVPGLRLFSLGHGRHPADPAFGAHNLPTTGVRGHDGYLVPGSSTLRAVALIGLGRGAEPTR